jgi:ABC-2 type transport system permease protein
MAEHTNGIINDLRNAILSTEFELRKHLRRRRLILVLVLAIFLSTIFYAIPPAFGIDFAESANSFASTNLAFITLLIIISGALFAGDAVSGDFEKKTGLLLFPTPQRRTSIFAGKYIAALLGVFFVVTVYYLATMLEIAQIYGFGAVSLEFAQSFGLALLYSTSVVSVIFFFSSILKRTISSALLGFFLLMMILPMISNVMMMVDVEPSFIVTYSSDLITDVLSTNAGFGGPSPGSQFGSASFAPELYSGMALMVVYGIILFIVAIIMADRRRME